MNRVIAMLAALIIPLSTTKPVNPPPEPAPVIQLLQRGEASYYGRFHHGKRTASGERFNMHSMTAASKTIPLGTLVKVVNLTNKKVVTVLINDRGPYVGGRILDLSQAAAIRLGMQTAGVAAVAIYSCPVQSRWR